MKARQSEPPTWSWKLEVSKAMHEAADEVESASLKLSDALARGFHKVGLHKAARSFEVHPELR